MKEDLANKIIAVGMLIIILISILNYGVIVVEKIMNYTIPEVSAAEIKIDIEERTTQDIYIIRDEIHNSIFDNALSLFNSLKSKVESVSLNISFEKSYIELNTLFQMTMGRNLFEDLSNTVAKLEND